MIRTSADLDIDRLDLVVDPDAAVLDLDSLLDGLDRLVSRRLSQNNQATAVDPAAAVVFNSTGAQETEL